MRNKDLFIAKLTPHAIKAIGAQHGWFVQWAIAKAGLECGYDHENQLIKQASNCLGIKAGYQKSDGEWHLFGHPCVELMANTGPEAGQMIPWRVFESLADCFAEFVRTLNDRNPYQPARNLLQVTYENIYTNGLAGHAETVIRETHSVRGKMRDLNICDKKGRIIVGGGHNDS